MKNRTAPFLLLLSSLIVGVTITGCATIQPVPYATGGLRLESPLSERKIDRPLTIRINEELLKLVVTIKPLNILGTMSYNFYVGESIRSNIVNTLNPLFRSVNVSTLPIKELKSHGIVLDVALKSYNFNLSPSIYQAHIVTLTMEYNGYEEDGKNIFTVLAETSGTSKDIFSANIRKTSYDWSRFSIEPSSATPYVHDMGNAYDVALSRSIDKLLTKLNEVWVRPPQGN